MELGGSRQDLEPTRTHPCLQSTGSPQPSGSDGGGLRCGPRVSSSHRHRAGHRSGRLLSRPTLCDQRSVGALSHLCRSLEGWLLVQAPGKLHWDDPRGSFIYSNNCGQRVVLENGDILLAFSFGSTSDHRSVATLRCRFNGETLSIAQVGTPLELKAGRGLLEPSLTRFGDRFYLTLRAEDGRGYLAVSQDGLHWNRKETWKWEDGQPLDLSSTQQHWLTHGEELFLVYTRKAMENQNVIRWRAPLWMARVNLEQHRLIRSSEQVVFPMIGDGVSQPDEVALMGNFHINPVSKNESWVTVGEWLPRKDARGNLLLARLRWPAK